MTHEEERFWKLQTIARMAATIQAGAIASANNSNVGTVEECAAYTNMLYDACEAALTPKPEPINDEP